VFVISRKNGQSLMIGDEIEVRIVSTDGNEVKLGFEAPLHTPIHREEIYQRIYGALPNSSAPNRGKRTRRSRRRRSRAMQTAQAT
jgi:carbon storage regulator